jgi:hypothetical protein
MNFKRDFLEASMALAPALSVPCEARLARGPAILSNPRNYRSASTNSQSSDPKAPNHQDGNPLPRDGPGAVQLILLLHPSHKSLDSRPNGHELVRAQSRAILLCIRLCWPAVLADCAGLVSAGKSDQKGMVRIEGTDYPCHPSHRIGLEPHADVKVFTSPFSPNHKNHRDFCVCRILHS